MVRRIAVVGAGWSGLAAAVQATAAGHQVHLFEMARHCGGRARSVEGAAGVLDNGQHILIGAYVRTLALMRQVGADPARLFERQPLTITGPDGRGLTLARGSPPLAFTRGVLAARCWPLADRLRLLRTAAGWWLRGFGCNGGLTVQSLCSDLPRSIVCDLIEPVCTAALNTPMTQASATVFLRVLQDALFSSRGSADLLLPRAPLSALLPDPARAWLARHGTTLNLGRRVQAVRGAGSHWDVDGERFDAVVLACSASEAARLTADVDAAWSARAAGIRYEPIVTVYLLDTALRLPQPMTALVSGPMAPAQFVFDLGRLGVAPGCFAFVVSSARAWTERGLHASTAAVLAQARQTFAGAFDGVDAKVIRHAGAERRATFACTPGLARPPMHVAPGLAAAGDYIDGPYPATLEGAVRAGQLAATAVSG